MTRRRCHGYPVPEHAPRFVAAAGANPNPLHFWTRGPQDVVPVKPFTLGGQRFQWKFSWFLERVEGVSRRAALRAIYQVLRDPRSWERVGVRWVRTMDRARANIVVRVIPMATTVCGPGAAGCYSSGYEADGKPVAELGVEYLGKPEFAELVNMELCGHGTFRALDMYNPIHQPYVGGCMGTWSDARPYGYYPSETEIAAVKAWLAGETEARYIHDD